MKLKNYASSVVKPVVDARANGFGLLKRSAVTKRYDFAVHQQRRSLQTDGLSAKDFCESNLKIVAPNVDCTCTEDGEPTLECDILLAECAVCDTIQGEITCLAFDQAATNTAITRHDFVDCYSYESGPFDGMVICEIANEAEDTCTVTIDGEECSTCSAITCVDDTELDLDCSNIIEGETWNLCTSEIPETSPFISYGKNDRFIDYECGSRGIGLSGGSGGFALSFHAVSVVVGLITVVATFW
jgi:hypothetical protein